MDKPVCSSCLGFCSWSDDQWVCDACGDEWPADDDRYAPPDEQVDLDAVMAATPCQCVLRTARKQHACSHCGEVIVKGERYIECFDSAPAYTSGDRFCRPCAPGELVPDQRRRPVASR